MDPQPLLTSEPAGPPAQSSRKKLFIIIGSLVAALILVIIIISLFVGKSNADKNAADYETQIKTYIASLSSKDGKSVTGDLDKYPKLSSSPFNFLSPEHQQALAKQAAVSEDIDLLKKTNTAYSYLKDDIRRTLYYSQSTFFFKRFSARTAIYDVLGSDVSAEKYAKATIKQYSGEANAAKEYLEKLKNPIAQELHKPEIKKLEAALDDFIKTANNCAESATAKPSEAKDQAADCNAALNRSYYDSLIHYDFIAYLPYSLEKVTPTNTLLTNLKEHADSSFSGTTPSRAKLQAAIDSRVALIKSLLPTSNKDKQFGPKTDIIRAFNLQIADAIKAADIASDIKAAYTQKLAPITASLTMYDNPAGKNGPDDAGGFVGALSSIISADEDRYDGATQHYAHYNEQLKKLKELKTPEYVKDEMKKIIAAYEASLSYYKESDELSKKAEDASKAANDAKKGSVDSIKSSIDAYSYTVASNNKSYGGDAVIAKANSSVAAIGNKIDDIKTMTKQVIQQYDDLLSLRQN